MKSMNVPGFTAEDSLSRTSGHYRTGRHVINSLTQTISAIYPAAEMVGEEFIVIVEKWPPDPWTPPFSGGHDGGAPSVPFDGGDGGGGGGGGGTGRRPKRPKLTPEQKERAREIKSCKDICETDHTLTLLKCKLDHPDPGDAKYGVCVSIAKNVLGRCKTRCEQP